MVMVLILLSGFMIRQAFSQDKNNFDQLSISAQQNLLNIFDRKEGKIYVYSASDGKLVATWVIEKIGQDLRKIEPAPSGYF
jgi:hypothetical protein